MGDSVVSVQSANTNAEGNDKTDTLPQKEVETRNNDQENGDVQLTQNEGIPVDVGTPCLASQDAGVVDAVTEEEKTTHSIVPQYPYVKLVDFMVKTPSKKVKKPARVTPLLRRTRNGRAQQEKQDSSGIKKEDIVILRAENAVLKTAMMNLEQKVADQNKDLTALGAELQFLKLEMKKASEFNTATEKRFSILQDEQEKKCEGKIQNLSSATQRKLDKINTKADQA